MRHRNPLSLGLIITVMFYRAQALFNTETTLTLLGSHTDFTTDDQGSFKHPFKHIDSSIEAIHFPETQTFSLKLTK